jgi:hypothetical protein
MRDPAHRGEGGLACAPEACALGLVGGDPDLGGAGVLAETLDLLEARVALALGAVELDQQRGARVHREAGLGHRLGGLDGEVVHHLDRPGNDPGAGDRGHGLAGVERRVEERDQRPRCLRDGHDPQRDPGDERERPLGADERAEQVQAGPVGLRPADRHLRAVGQDRVQPHDVVRREAVLEAVRTAGVLGDVAADRAHDLAARVGRVEVRRRDGRADLGVRHTGFHHDAPVLEVDLEHALHAAQDDHDPLRDGQGAAAQAAAGAAGDERRAVLEARLHRGGRLVGTAGQHDRAGGDRVLQQPVGFVGLELMALGDHVLGPADLLQALHQCDGDGHVGVLPVCSDASVQGSSPGARGPTPSIE